LDDTPMIRLDLVQ